MTDKLRDRIAAAIYSVQKPWDGFSFAELSEYTQSLYREQADAVIRGSALADAVKLLLNRVEE